MAVITSLSQLDLYEKNQVREYWILDPERECAFQFHLTEADLFSPATIYTHEDVLECGIFPDLKINLLEIFKQK